MRWEVSADLGVHAVLHGEHVDGVARRLEALEQRVVVAVVLGAVRQHSGRQLDGVAHQKQLTAAVAQRHLRWTITCRDKIPIIARAAAKRMAQCSDGVED